MPTATNIPVHVTNDVVAARIFLACEQRSRLHDLSGLTIPALRHLQIHPSLLQRMVTAGREAFDCGDSLARHRRHRCLTGPHRATVEMDGASAAHPDAATIFCPSKFKVLAHYPKQWCVRCNINVRRRAVNGEVEGHDRQTRESPCSRSGRVRWRFPVAAAMALRTAGAATQIVGSPTPPQNPPEGIRTVSTFGICLMRITS